MTVSELSAYLLFYPEDMGVRLCNGRTIADLDKVGHGVDMDTNIMSVWLQAKKEDD